MADAENCPTCGHLHIDDPCVELRRNAEDISDLIKHVRELTDDLKSVRDGRLPFNTIRRLVEDARGHAADALNPEDAPGATESVNRALGDVLHWLAVSRG